MSTTFSPGAAGQRHRPVADGQQRLHERHRQLAVGGEEEQPLGRLVPLLAGELQQPLPPRALLGSRAPAEDRGAEGRVDVLAVDQDVRRARCLTHGPQTTASPRRRARRRPGRTRAGYRGRVGTDDGRGRRRSLLLSSLGAGLLVLLVGVGEQRVGLRGLTASWLTVLDVGVESCNAHPGSRSRSRRPGAVTAFVDRPGILDGRTTAGMPSSRRAPLGTRVVVDGSNGEVWPCRPE